MCLLEQKRDIKEINCFFDTIGFNRAGLFKVMFLCPCRDMYGAFEDLSARYS
jgi:hypothetical protein